MRVASSLCLSLALSISLSSNALAQEAPSGPPAPADWGQALREDAQFVHDAIGRVHPGPVDPENPEFRVKLETGLTAALDRARDTTTATGYRIALQEYVNGFDDAHTSISFNGAAEASDDWKWPGFSLGYIDDGSFAVVYSVEPSGPPLGATLVSCDGVDAETLSQNRVGRRLGRWFLANRRVEGAPRLLIDIGDPRQTPLRRCVFRHDGSEAAFDLNWRPQSDAEFQTSVLPSLAAHYYRNTVGLRSFNDGFWFDLGTFGPGDQNPDLERMEPEVKARVDELRRAPFLVFDLRGNGGGSTSWMQAIVRQIWGQDRMNSAFAGADIHVDWRPSTDVINYFTAYQREHADDGEIRNDGGYLTDVITGMTAARDAGQPLWREVHSGQEKAAAESAAATPAPATPVPARVFVLTDRVCASACLDAVDLLKALGAVHVGKETNADAAYIQWTPVDPPHGRFNLYISTKVYRGRPRGHNESLQPDHVWTGNMDDTAGLEAWIAGLAAAR